jgi:hypothetical protein
VNQFRKLVVFAIIFGASVPFAATAETYGDDFGKCLVKSSSDADKHQLVEWIFAALSLNPAIAPYANIPADKREAINKGMASVFERLVGEECKVEATDALKYEGAAAFGIAFRLLGQVAGQQVFASPEVSAGSEEFIKHVDMDALVEKLGVKPDKP